MKAKEFSRNEERGVFRSTMYFKEYPQIIQHTQTKAYHGNVFRTSRMLKTTTNTNIYITLKVCRALS